MQSKAQKQADFPLVIYSYWQSDDPENEANLQYYVREGIREDDSSLHIILVDAKQVSSPSSYDLTPRCALFSGAINGLAISRLYSNQETCSIPISSFYDVPLGCPF